MHPFPSIRDDFGPHSGLVLTPRSAWRELYLSLDGVSPRGLLSPEQLDKVREVFPTAIGVRVLVSGYLVVLFESKTEVENIQASLRRP